MGPEGLVSVQGQGWPCTDDFLPARPRHQAEPVERIVRPPTTHRRGVWRRLRAHRPGMLGLIIIIAIAAAAIAGPWFSPYAYDATDPANSYLPPGGDHPLGTDNLGRDNLVRLLYGARISLAVGLAASLIALGLGVLYGAAAGYLGGRADEIMMRVVDVFYGVPYLLIVIVLMVAFKPGLKNVFITFGFVYWLQMARVVRGEVLALRQREFVLAARALGVPPWRVILRHLIPNAMGPILVTVTLTIPEAIFLESFLSFIGLGVSAPMASWGSLAADALSGFRSYPHMLLFPAAAIALTMLAFNFLGDGLRDALDPRTQR